MSEIESKDGINATITKLLEEWLTYHKDETFDLDTICRQLECTSRDARTAISKRLSRLVSQKILEKTNRIYRYVVIDKKILDWHNAKEEYFPLALPSNHNPGDLSYFGFSDAVKVEPGSLVVVAGSTNAGKSALCRNLLWDNMHSIHCQYLSSETTGAAFRRYANRMVWANPMNGEGKPVFELIERYRNYQDIIVPDGLNIIDWLNIESGEWYRIGTEMQKIKEKLASGIAIIAIQKDPGKEVGRGGTFSNELASLYLTIDYDKPHNLNWITVKKAKEWMGDHDPNGRIYGFEITDYGTQFSNIREIHKCTGCYGTGKTRGGECMACSGIGWVDGYCCRKEPLEQECQQSFVDGQTIPMYPDNDVCSGCGTNEPVLTADGSQYLCSSCLRKY
jgi:hypothetical protein